MKNQKILSISIIAFAILLFSTISFAQEHQKTQDDLETDVKVLEFERNGFVSRFYTEVMQESYIKQLLQKGVSIRDIHYEEFSFR